MLLHVFNIGPDYMVAADADHAWRIWCETLGENDLSYRQDLVQVDDSEELGIWCAKGGAIVEPGMPGASVVKMTCAEWVSHAGVGFLCSSEF